MRIPALTKIYFGFAVISGLLLTINYSRWAPIASYLHDWTDILIILMAGQNMISVYLIMDKAKEDASSFPIYVMVAFIFRLFMALIIMVLAWVFEVTELENFAINLIVLYLVFLAFELYSLLTNLRPNSEEGQH